MTRLSVEVRRKVFPAAGGRKETAVLADIALEIASGSFVAILGPSGCGKTTLLYIIAGLDADFDGRIDWSGDGSGERPKIGFVFQRPTLLPWRKVAENLRLVMTPAQIERQMDRILLEAMGLGAYGDSQRTMLMNALRGHCGEFGVVVAQSASNVSVLVEMIEDPESEHISVLAREVLGSLVEQLRSVQTEIHGLERKLKAWHRSDEASRRLEAISGVGVFTATALVATIGDAS